jgi:hypothetical protein
MNWIWAVWNWFVNALSAEFLLAFRANSGAVVLFRSLWTALWVMVLAIIFNSILHNGLTSHFQPGLIWKGFQTHPTWYAIVFAAVYTALYTRYASQWQYLAKLYNDIKSKEIDLASRAPIQAPAIQLLDDWKAAFIADANAMHLATQESYSTVIGAWLRVSTIRDTYKDANDPAAYDGLISRLRSVGVEVS